MDNRRTARPRARSEAIPSSRPASPEPAAAEARPLPRTFRNDEDPYARSPLGLLRRAATLSGHDGECHSRPRAPTTSIQPLDYGTSLNRRSTVASRRSVARSGGQRRYSLLQVGQAGPDDSSALRTAHENYVHPGYADLNPAYEQPASAKPVWSLAKPLPRVLRPGMIPTETEILQSLPKPARPAEHTQTPSADNYSSDLGRGRVPKAIDLAKASAQSKDLRGHRGNNVVDATVVHPRGTSFPWLESWPSRTSSQRSPARTRAESTASRRTSSPSREGIRSSHAHAVLDNFNIVNEHPNVPKPPLEQSIQAQDFANEVLTPQRTNGETRHSLDAIPEITEPPSGRQSEDTVILEAVPEYTEVDSRRSEETDVSDRTLDDEALYLYGLEELKRQVMNPPLYDEIYNNHTAWSVFRSRNREFLAELLGVFVQLTIGFCADTSATLNGNMANVNTTAWSWGFATMVAIYVSGGVSGAHLNPVITIILWFYRGFPKRKMLSYFAAQFLGAFLAALTAYGVYHASINSSTLSTQKFLSGFVTGYRDNADVLKGVPAFFNEFIATALLACAVLALGDDQNAPPGAGMNALIIGLLVTALTFAFSYQTGSAMNPSRDFGPRLAMLALRYGSLEQLFVDPYWFYGPWVGTLSGAFIGAAVYDVCIFEGGESPINYSWTRTKRSAGKGAAKWKARLRRARKPVKEDIEKGWPGADDDAS